MARRLAKTGRKSNKPRRAADFGGGASGVLYALGGASGGLTVYMDKGTLVYVYNMMIIERYIARSAKLIPAGKHQILVTTTLKTFHFRAQARNLAEL